METTQQRAMGRFVETVLRGMQDKNELREDVHVELRDLLCKAISLGSCSAARALVQAVPSLVDARVAEMAASTGDTDMLFSVIDIDYLNDDKIFLHVDINYEYLMVLYLDAIEPIVAAGIRVIPSSVTYSLADKYSETMWQREISKVIARLQIGMPNSEFEGMLGIYDGLRDILIRCMRLGACGAVLAIIDETYQLVTPELLELAARLGNPWIMQVFIDHMESNDWEFDEIVAQDMDPDDFTYLSLMRTFFDSISRHRATR